ncbi:MAG: L-serine ammonia-lyase, iron-sulfur-dependent subunit beta [Spirochaetaceae bacterium]|jgi:L-serine dehydratase|nr:L-serine ammonia-lyase, iron-sulfur-dependent subunit beta [Spirochaetaceae bacterium]
MGVLMNVFDIIGPIMIGPSSSHTAGALRIAAAARNILGGEPYSAEIGLAGSFARTGKGHGTDKALVAGLLGMASDDERIRDSFAIARERGLEIRFSEIRIPKAHPNTARLFLTGQDRRECSVQGASIGGGNIIITNVNGMETDFSGSADTLIIAHKDMPGMIAEVASLMAEQGINIGNFRLNRPHRGYQAVMVLEIDGGMNEEIAGKLRGLPHIDRVVFVKKSSRE